MMTLPFPPPQLVETANELRQGSCFFITPRELLSWFGNVRRTWRQVQKVRRALLELSLGTSPDFEGAGLDEEVLLFDPSTSWREQLAEVARAAMLKSSDPAAKATTIPWACSNSDVVQTSPASDTEVGPDASTPSDPAATSKVAASSETATPAPTSASAIKNPPTSAGALEVAEMLPGESQPGVAPADPVHRVSRFLGKDKPISVSRDDKVSVATTKMQLHDFSQLPVMQSGRTVDGLISWESLGRRMALGVHAEFVRDAMVPHQEIKSDASIFDAIRIIEEHGCVLVRAKGSIVGLLTATDISSSFEQLSKPFLLLGYIENHLRSLIYPKFSVELLQAAKDPADIKRNIADVADLTFGEYIRLLENQENWDRLQIGLERALFIEQLKLVKDIRNDVMHFNPEGIEDMDMDKLREFDSFLRSIVEVLDSSRRS